MASSLSLQTRITNCPPDLAGRWDLIDAVHAAIEEARRAGWEAAQEAAMKLCLAESDRQGELAEGRLASGDAATEKIYRWGDDLAATLWEDIKRMPYPEKKT